MSPFVRVAWPNAYWLEDDFLVTSETALTAHEPTITKPSATAYGSYAAHSYYTCQASNAGLVNSDSAPRPVVYPVTASGADYRVVMRLVFGDLTVNTNSMYLVARQARPLAELTDLISGYRGYGLRLYPSGTIYAFQWHSSGTTVIGSSSQSVSLTTDQEHEIELRVVGSAISIWFDGTQVENGAGGTDTTYTDAGQAGFAIGQSEGREFKKFYVEML